MQWSKIKNYMSLCKSLIMNFIRYRLKTCGCDYVLIDTPTHGNLGDHAIVLSEMQIFNRLGKRSIEITADEISGKEKYFSKFISSKKTIVVPGGGFLGSLWPVEEYRVRRIIKEFKNHRIIIFPQSITFDMDDNDGVNFFNESKKIYESHNNLQIFVREQKSYDFMKSYMPNVNISLVPDVVTIFRPGILPSKRKNILICKRKDLEGIIDEYCFEKIKETLGNLYTDEEIIFIDTVSSSCISPNHRMQEVTNILNEFASAKLVITDRLHGMIFAAITNTPCIAMNNCNGKVEGVYQWIKENEHILYVKDINSISEYLRKLDLSIEYVYRYEYVESKFNPLIDTIKGDSR